jgi:hypothetical protein
MKTSPIVRAVLLLASLTTTMWIISAIANYGLPQGTASALQMAAAASGPQR